MNYALHLESPDLDTLITELSARQIAIAMRYQTTVHNFGRTSPPARAVARIINALDRCIEALKVSREGATPEHAQGVSDHQQAAIQVGDDLKLVAGRSRNDPRYVKAKVR